MFETIEDWVLDLSAKTVWRVLVITYLLANVVRLFIGLLPYLFKFWRGYLRMTPEQRENHWVHSSRRQQQPREPVEPLGDPPVITMAGLLPDD
ncbi:MAG: hypothetical protein OXH07_11270 [Chloroflexi bacterium]|nr:hypothetical protein [Chloroflexota bacterium]